MDWAVSDSSAWAGPMNGQQMRQQLVRDLVRHVDIRGVVETGTYRGTTTEFLHHVTGGPVFSIESVPRYHDFASRRFAVSDPVHLRLGDSRPVLAQLAEDDRCPKHQVLFYLDAHWARDLPLHGELELIRRRWHDCVVMIDDFEVPGDPGYGFDD